METPLKTSATPGICTTLYQYATTQDLLLLSIATIACIGAGVALPLTSAIVGNLSGNLKDYVQSGQSGVLLTTTLNKHVMNFVYLAAGEFVLTYTYTVLFVHTGERITSRIRSSYLQAVLRCDIRFFDETGSGEITTRLTADTNLIQEAISEKFALTLNGIATFFATFTIGFIRFWRLTAICMSSVVTIAVVMGFSSYFITKWNKRSLNAYGAGENIVEEAFSSIRTITAFSSQENFALAYDRYLLEAMRWGLRSRTMLACMFGLVLCIVFLNYSLAFWMGGRFIANGDTDTAAVITIIVAVLIGIFAVGSIAPNIQNFSVGLAASSRIFNTVYRSVSPSLKSNTRLDSVKGYLKFLNVKHVYPTQPTKVALKNVNLTFPAGSVTAIVGESGSGKSSILSLIERFYDPTEGQITLDGHDISTLNVHWLRQQFAFVGQEPVLFRKSVKENIAYGLIGSAFEHESQESQQERIIEAAKKANIHDFISALPQGYDSQVGERGALVSGGQKQRIAIARAIVRGPRVLLLDEPTSALDTEAENLVQSALNVAANGRTIIVAAHRLSTIKNADNIVVLEQGSVAEQGTHQSLLERNGPYAALVAAQMLGNGYTMMDPGAEISKPLTTRIPSNFFIKPNNFSQCEIVDASDEKLALPVPTMNTSAAHFQAANKTLSKKTYTMPYLISFVIKFNAKEWKYMALGLALSIVSGAAQPVQGIFLAQAIVAVSQSPSNSQKFQQRVNFWALMNVMIGLVQLAVFPIQGFFLAICSERLVFRARSLAFRHILRQDIEFFDIDKNSTGALASFLSTDATRISALSGQTLSIIMSCLSTVIIAIVVSLALGWKLALVCLCSIPVILGSGFLRVRSLAKFLTLTRTKYRESAGFACEYINAIRTVASFTMEKKVLKEYRQQLDVQIKASLKSTLVNSIYFAASQSIIFLAFALGFWYGGTLIGRREYTLFQVFLVLSEILLSTRSTGTAFAYAGDMAKAKNAATEFRKLFDQRPAIDSWSSDGQTVDGLRGEVDFRDVHFRYPTRPDVPVLCGFNMSIKAGEKVALVGSSGCGKSTIISLIERFYEASSGGIFVDGHNVSSLHLNEYRKHIALVSQEYLLYEGTIKENLLLGLNENNDTNAGQRDERMIQACKDANIDDFIQSLPNGYATELGPKSVRLSGGQRQRIAIARALLRNPRILLLDEATSSLDSRSEELVQAALDKAAEGRTTISVAQRLSTIRNADCIYVIDNGVVIESGTHQELMQIQYGHYHKLVMLGDFKNKSSQSD